MESQKKVNSFFLIKDKYFGFDPSFNITHTLKKINSFLFDYKMTSPFTSVLKCECYNKGVDARIVLVLTLLTLLYKDLIRMSLEDYIVFLVSSLSEDFKSNLIDFPVYTFENKSLKPLNKATNCIVSFLDKNEFKFQSLIDFRTYYREFYQTKEGKAYMTIFSNPFQYSKSISNLGYLRLFREIRTFH